MKKNVLKTIIWSLAMSISIPVMAVREQLRVMTFNVPYGNVNTPTNTWEMRAKSLHEYINRVSPDLLGMQEPVRDELISILSGIPGYAMTGVARDDGAQKGEYTPIVYKTSRFRVLETGNYWLSDTPEVPSFTPGAAHRRIATWAFMEDKLSGARFLFTNTHISYEHDTVRIPQIKVLKDHMHQLRQRFGAELPQILTGDFNQRRSDESYTYTIGYNLKLKDMWLSTRNQRNLNGSADANAIDYVFASSNVYCTYVEWGNAVDESGVTMSDHHPLFADIYFNTSAADDARQEITRAWAEIDSTLDYTHRRVKLVSTATQLSSDGVNPSYPLSNILDGNTSTYCQSLENLPPAQPHYIQINLRKAVENVYFHYIRRNDPKEGLLDRWLDVMITASNDGITWDYIDELNEMGHTSLATYTSPNIALRKPYTMLRFNVLRTPGMRLCNGSPLFSLSEFQVYENVYHSQCLYMADAEVRAAADYLKEMIATTQASIEAQTITEAEIANLKQATLDLQQKREYAMSLPAILQGNTASVSRIYGLDGRIREKPAKGVNVIVFSDGTREKYLIN